MRPPVFHFALVLGALAAGSALAAPPRTPSRPASLTLYEKAGFTGRHVTFHAAADTARQAFDAHSAKSVGVWTLCEGRDPASKCQTVDGPAPKLKVGPAIVRPGVDAVALYEEPGLKGRRVVYSFASDQPPPFKARSARTWGGAWTLCDAASDRCQTVNGEHPAAIDIEVGQVQPGRPPERLQLAMASPPPQAAAPEPVAPEPPPAAEPVPPKLEPPPVAPAAAPAPELEAAPDPPPPVRAEAEPPRAAPALSPYVDIPLPPRERPAPRDELQPAPPPERAEISIPPPAPRLPSPVRRVGYVCDNGQGLTVLFDDRDETAMVLSSGRDPVALRRSQDREAGGFFYEGGGHVLFGAGGRAGYATDGSRPVDCYAGGARRQLSYRDERPYGRRFDDEPRYEDEADDGPADPQERR
jgi:hypothetical protein